MFNIQVEVTAKYVSNYFAGLWRPLYRELHRCDYHFPIITQIIISDILYFVGTREDNRNIAKRTKSQTSGAWFWKVGLESHSQVMPTVKLSGCGFH